MTKTIYMKNGTEILVDDEDFEEMNKRAWRNVAGYAARGDWYVTEDGQRKKRTVHMHQLINKTPKGMMTDHINGDKMDNRKCNLRSVTAQQNQWNKSPKKNGKQKYKGVRKGSPNRWRAYIEVSGQMMNIGSFKTEIDAATAYNFYAEKYHGEYAKLNTI